MEPVPYPDEIDDRRPLSFADGFQFGCGFFVAAAVAATLAILLIALLGLVMSLLGVGLLQDLLGGVSGPLLSLAGA